MPLGGKKSQVDPSFLLAIGQWLNMDILGYSLVQVQVFVLIFVRMLSIFMTAPFFGSQNIPALTKITLSFLFSVILLPFAGKNTPMPQESLAYLTLLAQQVLVGGLLGFTAILVFIATQLAGHLVDIQIGFGIMNVIDPLLGIQVSLLGQFSYLLSILVFLSVNGHHFLLSALAQSFQIVPLNEVVLTGPFMHKIQTLGANLFVLGLKLSAPVLGFLFLLEVIQGIISRTVPQINIFLVGFPLRIGMGLFVMSLSFPFFVYVIKGLFSQMYRDMWAVMHLL